MARKIDCINPFNVFILTQRTYYPIEPVLSLSIVASFFNVMIHNF